MSKIIFITGASRGLGRIWAEAFLDRGDKVIGTSRNLSGLKELADKYGNSFLPLELEVTDRAAVFNVIDIAAVHFGKLDVIINNAGVGGTGAVEELTEDAVRALMDTNFFGTLWVTQAALPILRRQGSGHIIQVSSALGIYSFPTVGLYSASKFAVEGLSEALALEIKDMGINVTILEPNGYATDFNNYSVKSDSIAAYDNIKSQLYANPEVTATDAYGDPKATAAAVLQLVDASNPPLRLILGKKAFPLAERTYSERLVNWKTWNDVAVKAHGF